MLSENIIFKLKCHCIVIKTKSGLKVTTNSWGLWYASFGLDKTLIDNPLPQIHLSKPWSQQHEFAFLEHLSFWPLLSPLWWCYLQAWFYHYHNSASWQVSDCNNLHLQKFARLEKEVNRPLCYPFLMLSLFVGLRKGIIEINFHYKKCCNDDTGIVVFTNS